MVSDEVRRTRFAAFVDRAVRAAHDRGWTTDDIVTRTGVSSSTIYRWRNREWAREPQASQVRKFCDGIGASIEEAYNLLGWGADKDTTEPQPLENPLLIALARRLADPRVSLEEKGLIEETIRMWVARGASERKPS